MHTEEFIQFCRFNDLGECTLVYKQRSKHLQLQVKMKSQDACSDNSSLMIIYERPRSSYVIVKDTFKPSFLNIRNFP
jgi:hypothetical protein